MRWTGSDHAASRRLPCTGPSVSRTTDSSRPRHCRSVPAQVCTFRGGPSYAGWPASAPRAPVGDRAAPAPRVGRRADQRPELHHGHRPGGSRRLVLGQRALRQGAFGLRDRGGRELRPGQRAGQDAAHVGVEHDVATAVGEDRDRGSGVVADAGQGDQVVVGRRHLAAVPLHDRGRRGVEPERPARVAEPAPGPDRLARRHRREVGGCRPLLEPGRVHRQHPGDRRLLQHELRHHHRPGAGVGRPPRQVAGVLGVPVEDRLVQGRRGRGTHRPRCYGARCGTTISGRSLSSVAT